MPYFPVDDQMAFHPKIIAAGNTAIGLWVRAGSWAKAHASGGKIPKEIVSALGTEPQAQRLVTVGLWERVTDGYQFHDWEQQTGNFTPEQEKQQRESNRQRQRDKRERDKQRDKQRESQDSHGVTNSAVTQRPSPSPSQHVTDIHVSPVVNRENSSTDDSRPVDKSAHWAQFGITDIKHVQREVIKRTGIPVTETETGRVIGLILAKAEKSNTTILSPQAYVISSIRHSWAEIQQSLNETVT